MKVTMNIVGMTQAQFSSTREKSPYPDVSLYIDSWMEEMTFFGADVEIKDDDGIVIASGKGAEIRIKSNRMQVDHRMFHAMLGGEVTELAPEPLERIEPTCKGMTKEL
jgi:hypothetical protein